MDPYETWTIVDLALRAILIMPLLIIWLISFCAAPGRGDHARLGFSFLKAAIPCVILSLLVYVAADAVYFALAAHELNWMEDEDYYEFNVFDYPPERDTRLLLDNTIDRLDTIGLLFQYIADILLMFCFVELGNGFLYCLAELRTGLQRAARFAAIGLGVILFTLAIAQFGVFNTQYSNYFNNQAAQQAVFNETLQQWTLVGPSFDDAAYERGFQTANNLCTAFDVLILVAGMAMLAYAGYILHTIHPRPQLKSSAVLVLVATIIQLIRYVYNVAMDGAYYIPNRTVPFAVANAVDPILNHWTYFVLLVLLFVVGIRKQKGIWTVAQPWMNWSTPVAMMPPPHQPPLQPMGYAPQYVMMPYGPDGQYQGQVWQQPQPQPQPQPQLVPVPVDSAPPKEAA